MLYSQFFPVDFSHSYERFLLSRQNDSPAHSVRREISSSGDELLNYSNTPLNTWPKKMQPDLSIGSTDHFVEYLSEILVRIIQSHERDGLGKQRSTQARDNRRISYEPLEFAMPDRASTSIDSTKPNQS
jgi:hypothetical protein